MGLAPSSPALVPRLLATSCKALSSLVAMSSSSNSRFLWWAMKLPPTTAPPFTLPQLRVQNSLPMLLFARSKLPAFALWPTQSLPVV